MKTNFQKGQAVGVQIAAKDPELVKAMALEAMRRGHDWYEGFKSGMLLALQEMENIKKSKEA